MPALGRAAAVSDVLLTPAFVMAGTRGLFCMRHGPADARVTRRLLVVPPFAEEMNKCRRLLTLLARALATRGVETWLPDFYGTGDSEGDFSDAGWSDWQNDLIAVAALASSSEDIPTDYLALRSGALLLGQVHARLPRYNAARVLLWQPVLEGSRYLAQFLRVRVMASKLAGADESQQMLMQQFGEGRIVEVAGYGLSPGLALGLQSASIGARDFSSAAQLHVFEFKNSEGAEASVPSQNLVRDCLAAGGTAALAVVNCEQFWASQEIAAPMAAVEASVAALLGAGRESRP